MIINLLYKKGANQTPNTKSEKSTIVSL